jgi:subtilisin family serine protease
VINLSLGSEIPTTNRTFDEVMTEVQKFPLPRQINSIITVAAGNGGAPCATSNLNGCNAVAVSLAFQNQTKASTIVVGALTGSGASENIATYSTRAGILADRFILAQGGTGFFANMQGTSFAAPRVAGVAALLKHKYPSLTAAQISSVILLSADKDINNDGIPDFTGVSPIFGHGKLSLSRALALAGAI